MARTSMSGSRYITLMVLMMFIMGCGGSSRVDPSAVTAEQEEEMKQARAEVDNAEAAKAQKSRGGQTSGYVNPEESAARRGR